MIVEIDISGVDGSEVHQYLGEFEWLNERAPVIFGDEIIGRVVASGNLVREQRGLEIGDRVTVEARWSCAECYPCMRGQYYLCESGAFQEGYGTTSLTRHGTLWGGYATHLFVPAAATVYRVPDALDDRSALVASSVLANGTAWTDAAGVTAGTRIAIIGPGPQGLACALAAWVAGAEVVLVGVSGDAQRLEAVVTTSIRTVALTDPGDLNISVAQLDGGSNFDAVIETAGAPTAKALSQNLVRTMGTIVNVSVAAPAVQTIDWVAMLMKQVTIKSVVSHPKSVVRSFDLALDLQSRGFDLADWVTHTFSLYEAEKALRTAGYLTSERPVKTVIIPRMDDAGTPSQT